MQFRACVDQKGTNGSPTLIIHIYALNKYLYVLCMTLDQGLVNFLRDSDILEFISYRVSVSGPQP